MAEIKTRGTPGIRVASRDLANGTVEYMRGEVTPQQITKIIRETAKKRAEYYIERSKKGQGWVLRQR